MSAVRYARAGADDQSADGQHDVVSAAWCEPVFVNATSGTLVGHPSIDA